MNTFGKAIFLGLSFGLLGPATAGDLLQGGRYNNSSSDFPRHVTASQGPRTPVIAEDAHHNDGGQDRSGRDWAKGATSYSRERPADASAYPSPQQWGWSSK